MISQTEENYLKALFNLTTLKGKASVNEISKLLDIKMPTVNSMMKRLSKKGLVIYESYKPLKLTNKGLKEAALIIRKYRLTEMYLIEKMGFGWDEVHKIAEQIEHIQSQEFFDKIDELLGYPKVGLHGFPIPDSNGKMVTNKYISLSECNEGDLVTFKAVQLHTEDLFKFLNAKELVLGIDLEVKSKEPFDKSMTISYSNRKPEVLSCQVCDKLLVKRK